jgi:hypothetical protein
MYPVSYIQQAMMGKIAQDIEAFLPVTHFIPPHHMQLKQKNCEKNSCSTKEHQWRGLNPRPHG